MLHNLLLFSLTLGIPVIREQNLKLGINYQAAYDEIEKIIQEGNILASAEEDSNIDEKYNIGRFIGFSGNFSESMLETLRQNENIEEIEPDQTVTQASIQYNAPWHLSRLSRLQTHGSQNFEYPSNAGEGIYVYVVDSGVAVNHVEFEGRAENGFLCRFCTLFNLNEHGTQVAGVIASKTYGIAKKTNIISVKFMQNKFGSTSQLISAIQWITNDVRRRNIMQKHVVNMSLRFPYSRILDDVLSSAEKAGINFVVAAGNDNSNSCHYSMNGVSGVVSVGATNIDDFRAGFSNWGYCVDIYAPGSGILTITSDGVGYTQGTSLAAPLVAGALAIQLSLTPHVRPFNSLKKISIPFSSGSRLANTDKLLNLVKMNNAKQFPKSVQPMPQPTPVPDHEYDYDYEYEPEPTPYFTPRPFIRYYPNRWFIHHHDK